MIDERTASDIKSLVKGVEYLRMAVDGLDRHSESMAKDCAIARVDYQIERLVRLFYEIIEEHITDSKANAAICWHMLNKQYDKIHLILDSICEKGRQWNPQPQSSSSAETSAPTTDSSP